jgi:hypothetical protein
MMDLQTIEALTEEMTAKAETNDEEPLYVTKEILEDLRAGNTHRYAIPFLGDYVPEGWRRTERELYFCDTSGFGQRGERALTMEEFFNVMAAGYGYAIIEAGQFQAYVAQYEECE